jgi:iron complex outermembrane recepter protein
MPCLLSPTRHACGRYQKAIRVSAALAVATLAGPGVLGADELDTSELKALSLEQLMDVQVSMVSRREESAFTTPAAASVITADDIRRTGVQQLPEALRLAPGLQVARINTGTWAISSRGFNDQFGNKLLVLHDGRTIYTPIYSGVLWQLQDTMVEDLERIEVIRGAGGALWGANAVNGIINIASKSAKDTQGMLLSVGGGNELQAFAGMRYGFQIGEKAWGRVYGRFVDQDSQFRPAATDDDTYRRGTAGFRFDWEPGDRNKLTLIGDVRVGEADQQISAVQFGPQLVFPPVPGIPPVIQTASMTNYLESVGDQGANLLGRWTHTFSDTSEMRLQAYYDRVVIDNERIGFTTDTADVDFQHRFNVGSRNALTYGGAYRFISNRSDNSDFFQYEPSAEKRHVASVFLQDEVTLVPDRLKFTVGTKLEHNEFTGWEYQPSGRLVWTPSERHTVWAAVGRAVRIPAMAERSTTATVGTVPFQLAPGSPGLEIPLRLRRSPGLVAEELINFELGYRVRPLDSVTVDLSVYYNRYDHLRGTGADTAALSADGFVDLAIANSLRGESYGGELSVTWQAREWWRLQASYVLARVDVRARDEYAGWLPAGEEGTTPEHQFTLRSSLDLPKGFFLDTTVRYVARLDGQESAIPGGPVPAFPVPSYWELDGQVGWRVNDRIEIGLVGRNLINDHHKEFGPSIFAGFFGSEVERALYLRLNVKF